VIDSFDELTRVSNIAKSLNKTQKVYLRLTPGVDAHTHEFISTAHEDVKFGFSIASGAAWVAVSFPVQRLLDNACWGSFDGGSGTAAETSSVLNHCDAIGSGSAALADDENTVYETEAAVPHDSNGAEFLVSVRLSLEEALFMQMAHKLLEIHMQLPDGSLVDLRPDEVWSIAYRLRGASFATSYVAYHHLRAKGFIPRSGLQYGSDYVIYRRHPSLCHSEACVRIVPLREDDPIEMPPWHDLSSAARLCGQVSKGLLLLFVRELKGADTSDLQCLEYFQVQEMKATRWTAGADHRGLNQGKC
jgi:tRNA-intron lyase